MGQSEKVAITLLGEIRLLSSQRISLMKPYPLEEGSYQNVLGFDFSENQIYAILETGKSKLKDQINMLVIVIMAMRLMVFYTRTTTCILKSKIDPNHPIGQTDKAGIRYSYGICNYNNSRL